jgi:hypothetical protein
VQIWDGLGWIAAQLVRAATEPQLRKPISGTVNPALLDELDVIDNQWFPIIKYALTQQSPEISARRTLCPVAFSSAHCPLPATALRR